MLIYQDAESRKNLLKLDIMMTPMFVMMKLVDVADGSPSQKAYLRNESQWHWDEETGLEKGNTESGDAKLDVSERSSQPILHNTTADHEINKLLLIFWCIVIYMFTFDVYVFPNESPDVNAIKLPHIYIGITIYVLFSKLVHIGLQSLLEKYVDDQPKASQEHHWTSEKGNAESEEVTHEKVWQH